MNSPSPCSYHQKATAVATSSASSALAILLRSSVRWATRLIVASASLRRRGFRVRCSVTVVLPRRGGSERPLGPRGVGRGGVRPRLVGPGPQLGGARLGQAGLLEQLRGQLAGRRGRAGRGGGGRRRGRHDLTHD